jgi:hypothetical protein
MKDPSALPVSERYPHSTGLFIAFFAFMVMTDLAAVPASVLGPTGFKWQAEVLIATPILCVVACLIVFLLSPVGNRSRSKLIRGIGHVSVLGRYWLFAGVVCAVVLLELLILYIVMLTSLQSLTLLGDVPYESSTRIQQDAGEGVIIFRSNAGETRVLFRPEKRATVERALRKQHIEVKE